MAWRAGRRAAHGQFKVCCKRCMQRPAPSPAAPDTSPNTRWKAFHRVFGLVSGAAGDGAGLCIQRLQHTLNCPCAARRPALHATDALGMTKQASGYLSHSRDDVIAREWDVSFADEEGLIADDLQYP